LIDLILSLKRVLLLVPISVSISTVMNNDPIEVILAEAIIALDTADNNSIIPYGYLLIREELVLPTIIETLESDPETLERNHTCSICNELLKPLSAKFGGGTQLPHMKDGVVFFKWYHYTCLWRAIESLPK
jgi:hypothetical protein